MCGTLLGIEERRGVSGERKEDLVEHGNGDNGRAPVFGASLRLRTVRRWTKTMSKLNNSKRHMEGRVALRTLPCVNCWLDAASVADAQDTRSGHRGACPRTEKEATNEARAD